MPSSAALRTQYRLCDVPPSSIPSWPNARTSPKRSRISVASGQIVARHVGQLLIVGRFSENEARTKGQNQAREEREGGEAARQHRRQEQDGKPDMNVEAPG